MALWTSWNSTMAMPFALIPNDLKAMTDACWAVFYHSLSTDEKPHHEYFPVGAKS